MSLGNQQLESRSTQYRLGESLQTAGLLSPKQLDEALEYQHIYGGKLGTSLIELGLLDENQLAKTLSRQLGQPFIKPEFLMKIPASVLNIIPEEIALKYHIIPYHEDGKKLFVAMNETRNLKIIDDLSFQLDRIIIPLAIPEIRLMLALRKYYRTPIPPRYQPLARQIIRRGQPAKALVRKKKPAPASPGTSQKEKIRTDDPSSWPLLDDAQNTAEEERDSYYAAKKHEPNTFNLTRQLANAQNRDDIATAIISHFKPDFPNCALLLVHKNEVNGWIATVKNSKQRFEQIAIPLTEPSVFNLVVTNLTHYLGPMTKSLQNLRIMNFFNVKGSADVIVYPFMVQKRIVCLLYMDGRIEDLSRRLTELKSIAGKVELSFKMLILKNKILRS